MAKYFTIKTFSSVGVGDQLGTQFARLFLIGEAIGATYLHTPLEIQRSAESNFRRRIRGFFFFLKKILINFPVQHKSIALIAKSLNLAERIISRLDRTDINGRFLDFLGLNISADTINDPITPFLSEIIKKVSTKEELIASLKWQYSDHESIVLEWTPELYPYCYKLDDLFNSGKTINFNQFLNNAFWKNKNKDAPNEEKLFVVHQRCGDSVTLLSDAGKVVIYGNEVTFDNEDTEQFDLNNDKNRVGRAIEMYVEVLQELQDLRGSGTKIVFISDGYQTSKNILLNHYFSKFSTLNNSQKKAIKNLINKDLNQFLLNDKLEKLIDEKMIGETYENLEKSILLLARAKVLMFGSGGFAYYMHSLFSNKEQTYLGHINEKNEILIANTREMLKS
ncbi:MAG: hypothetical protein LCH67_03595 [Bacteroidetes bacterium]|nr:hypothetical protein [Bacteroidota bacterium]